MLYEEKILFNLTKKGFGIKGKSPIVELYCVIDIILYASVMIANITMNVSAIGPIHDPANNVGTTFFTERENYTLAGFSNANHLQDVTTDGSHIYSCWGNALAKHTLTGAFITSNTSSVLYHSGGLCYYDGYLYVAYSNSFIGGQNVAVRKYDATDLSYVTQYVLTDSLGGIGCIAFYDDKFYVGELISGGTHDLRVFIYNTSFDLQDTIIVVPNYTGLGIETIERVGDYWIIGTYHSACSCIIADNNWQICKISNNVDYDTSIGCALIGNNSFIRATQILANGLYTGNVHYMELCPEKIQNGQKEQCIYATVIGNDESSTVFKIPHSFELIGYDSIRPHVKITPTNANMAAASWYISDYNSSNIEITFRTAPVNGQAYTFEISTSTLSHGNDSRVLAAPVHKIPDVATLRAIRDAVNANRTYKGTDAKTASYILTDDITMETGDVDWSPIGNGTVKFGGTFDGTGHSIIGLSIIDTSSCKGLFGYISGAMIRDLSLTDVNIIGPTSAIGALAGRADNSIITDCTSAGSVAGSGLSVGGLVGKCMSATIVKDCSSACLIAGAGEVGGLMGYNNSANVTHSYATGAVTSSVAGAGGFVGKLETPGKIMTSYATGSVDTGASNDAGGFIGVASAGVIINCYATGAVNGTAYVGGFVGKLLKSSQVQCCHAIGTVTGKLALGGLCGFNSASKIKAGFYNMTTTGMTDTGKGEGVDGSGVLYKTESTFIDETNAYRFDFTNSWVMGTSYPKLQ